MMEKVHIWGMNLLWGGWSAAMITECLSLVIGVIGGITLIWLNVEGIITHRKNREK
jgi:hypothetical protein